MALLTRYGDFLQSAIHFTFISGVGRYQSRCPILITLAQFGRCLQDPQQVSIRIQPVFPRRLNRAVDYTAGFCTTRRIGKQPVFPMTKGLILRMVLSTGNPDLHLIFGPW